MISLYAEINEDGLAVNIKVVRSLEPELDVKAIRALQQWRFKPAKKEGKPVTVAANIDIDFRLPRYPLCRAVAAAGRARAGSRGRQDHLQVTLSTGQGPVPMPALKPRSPAAKRVHLNITSHKKSQECDSPLLALMTNPTVLFEAKRTAQNIEIRNGRMRIRRFAIGKSS